MKKLRNKKEGELLVKWLQTEPVQASPVEEEDLDPETKARYERLRRADKYTHDHGSEAIAVDMLVKHYGYSEATARRDICEAQQRFGELESHNKAYYAKLMIDLVHRSLLECIKDRKWRELAGMSKELREWLGYADAVTRDPKVLLNEVPRMLMFSPAQMGVERNRNILAEVQSTIEAKTGKPFKMPEFPDLDEPEAEDERQLPI